MATNIFPFQKERDRQKPALNLPPPRIWSLKDLAAFLGVSVSWCYKRTQESCEDRIPRIPGIGNLRFDTHHPDFQNWISRQLGYVDRGESDG